VSALPDAGGAFPGRLTASPAPPIDPHRDAARALAVAQRLDAFRALATPTFHTREGDVAVPIPFHMAWDYRGHGAVVTDHAGALAGAGRRAGMPDGVVALVTAGRGTPLQVARLTQQLIDEGHLPPDKGEAPGLPQRVRKMMFDHGIGLDCAGYVQQALLASRAVTRASAGLRPPVLENLAGLAGRGYARVPLDEIRAGDLVILQPPPPSTYNPAPVGHTAIVREAHATTAPELAFLTEKVGVSTEAAAGGRWTTIVLDSSWGSGGDSSKGGVDRRTWWHDGAGGGWAWTGDDGAVSSGATPCNHTVEGIYRIQGR